MEKSAITHVSDTALWVAHFRAEESERADALFRDPYARRLAGERGREIAEFMRASSRYTAWVMAIRTRVIDRFIEEMIREGIDTVLNLGAGLDARPYRMSLPESLRWIEADYPRLLDYKENILAAEKPRCRLERIRIDLAERADRRKMLAEVAAGSRKALVITEGVIPYLTERQVAELGEDLAAHAAFRFWVAEYFSPGSYRYLRSRERARRMRNAPFQFFPADWFGFFRRVGWGPREVKFLGEESRRLNRKVPAPWWAHLLLPLLPEPKRREALRFSAYVLFARA